MKQTSHIYSRSMKKKTGEIRRRFLSARKRKGHRPKKLTHKTTLFVFFTRMCVYPRMYLTCVCVCVCVWVCVSFAYIYRDISSKNISSKLATIKISRKLANSCVSRCVSVYVYACVHMCVCVYVCMYNNFRFHLILLWFVISPFTRIVKWKILSLRGVEIKASRRIKKETAFGVWRSGCIYGHRFLRMRGQRYSAIVIFDWSTTWSIFLI